MLYEFIFMHVLYMQIIQVSHILTKNKNGNQQSD